MKENLYTIIKETEFCDLLTELAANDRRHHDVEMAIDYALSRNPECFTHIRDDFYKWKFNFLSPDFPQLIITYKFLKEQGQVLILNAVEVTDLERVSDEAL